MTALVLAVETSTDVASVAVSRGLNVIAEEESRTPIRNDQLLLPRIHAVLGAAGVRLQEIDLLAVALGPGSFGGLRVGLATVKGLAIAGRTPTIGVCSLTALARAAPKHAGWVLTLIDAHRGELYAALFERERDGLIERLAPFCGSPESVTSQVRAVCGRHAPYVLGDGLRDHQHALLQAWPSLAVDRTAAVTLPRARHVATLALSRLAMRGPDDLAALLPNYMRESDAKLPLRPLHLSPDQQ